MVDQDIREETPSTKDLDARLTGTLDISVEELIQEVLSRSGRVPPPPDSFTLAQFCDETGLSDSVGRAVLEEQAEGGFLSTALTCLPGKSRVRVWWRNLT